MALHTKHRCPRLPSKGLENRLCLAQVADALDNRASSADSGGSAARLRLMRDLQQLQVRFCLVLLCSVLEGICSCGCACKPGSMLGPSGPSPVGCADSPVEWLPQASLEEETQLGRHFARVLTTRILTPSQAANFVLQSWPTFCDCLALTTALTAQQQPRALGAAV